MAARKIAGILRAEAFSPNRVADDTAIFSAVCENLQLAGCEVEVFSEEQFLQSSGEPEIVVGMYRRQPTLDHLKKLEETGTLAINSARGVENCSRELMTRILTASGIQYPESLILDTRDASAEDLEKAGFEACWIKCADADATGKEEATFCRSTAETMEKLQEMAARGIRRVVINRHIDGRWIKFYGVAGTPFFHWYFPEDAAENPANAKELDHQLRQIGESAAKALGITIYGGDCILTPRGEVVVVDLNDWPSFAPCREEAARHIAASILESIRKLSDS